VLAQWYFGKELVIKEIEFQQSKLKEFCKKLPGTNNTLLECLELED